MNKYTKMLVGIGDASLKCYADKGDYLYLAGANDKMKGRLPKEHHFFVSVTGKRIPSRYGVVKTLKEPITAKQLALLDAASLHSSLKDEEMDLTPYEEFLIKVNSFPEHIPLATTWIEKGILKKTRELRVHKVFFTGMTKEEKKEIFES
ncbi:hypothetical protein [Bacillus sp. CECT 9360]|uniref:hypothetical protein n=1 Tax=Bacillus sp. CECT 9360 TaxID=2845821 RepID=UPI001E44C005|nr:hypothetical protein [Bacillus sp. CECT 9360]CAH0344624.1 hypothetical protein BCI9360_00884 [Bacillus sp. CECT 9360]